jgi:hypothetical protein
MRCEKCTHLEYQLLKSNNPWVKRIYRKLFETISVTHSPTCEVCGLTLYPKKNPTIKEEKEEREAIFRMIRL